MPEHETASTESLTIRHNDRVVMVGYTGCGKTTLARELLRRAPRLVVIDTKANLSPERGWDLEIADKSNERDLVEGKPARLRYIPPVDETPDYYAEILHTVWDAQDCIVYLDELYAVVPPGTRAPGVLSSLITRGREYGIGVWVATQRPAWVPIFCLSEAQHFFLFQLQMPEDRDRMAGIIGAVANEPIADEHGFYYRAQRAKTVIYFRKHEIPKSRQGGD